MSKYNDDINSKNYHGFADGEDFKAGDDRLELFQKQRLERGFDDTELWSLDHTIAKFIAPRLKAFKEQERHGYPATLSSKKWENALDKMCVAFDWLSTDEKYNQVYPQEVKDGLKVFIKHFGNLWD